MVGKDSVGEEEGRVLVREVGNWVQGDRFWNRTDELQEFTLRLREGANISLIAPRRVGKTSLMRECARQLAEEFHCVNVDLQASSRPADFFAELVRRTEPLAPFQARVREIFGRLSDKVESVQIAELSLTVRDALESRWIDRADRLIEALVGLDRRVILFLDEVPIFVHRLLCAGGRDICEKGEVEAEAFLSWLRRTALAHPQRLQVVLTGSIGLEPLLRRVGMSGAMNAYYPFEIRPWDKATACACLRALARNYDVYFATHADEQAISRLGVAIPHHVQLFFDYLLDHVRQRGAKAIFPGDVDEVYEQRMLGVRGQSMLAHYEERLEKVLSSRHLALGLDLLDEAATRQVLEAERVIEIAAGVDPQLVEEVGFVLEVLVHDGYLVSDQSVDGYRFESLYVRDWWKRRCYWRSRSAIGRRNGR